MRTAIAMSFLLSACSNVGPFRASGDDRADAGVGIDGSLGDANPPGTTKLTDLAGSPYSLGVTDGYVYWMQLDSGKLARVAKSGGTSQTIIAGGAVFTLKTSGSDVFWLLDDELRSASDGSFAVKPALYSSTALVDSVADGFAVSSTDVYFLEDGADPDTLMKIPRGGGTPQMVRDDLGAPEGVSVDGTDLYIAHGSRIDKSALTTPTNYTQITSVPTGLLTSEGGRACWITRPTQDPSREVWCRFGGQTKMIATAPGVIFQVTMSKTSVYWLEEITADSTALQRYDFTTNQVKLVETPTDGRATIYEIAVDAEALYWMAMTNDTAGEIWRMPF
jgi:hypothetical protein